MENVGNSSIMELTVKTGETIILKGEDGATIREVKKPKRNVKKVMEWEKNNYHRFTFLIAKEQAKQFIEILDGKRPLDWFRDMITDYINKSFNDSKDVSLNDNSMSLNDIEDKSLNDNQLSFNDSKDVSLNNNSISLNDIKNKSLNDNQLSLPKECQKKPAPTKEEIAKWNELNNNGMKWNEIAKQTNRKSDAIRKSVERYRKTQKP